MALLISILSDFLRFKDSETIVRAAKGLGLVVRNMSDVEKLDDAQQTLLASELQRIYGSLGDARSTAEQA